MIDILAEAKRLVVQKNKVILKVKVENSLKIQQTVIKNTMNFF